MLFHVSLYIWFIPVTIFSDTFPKPPGKCLSGFQISLCLPYEKAVRSNQRFFARGKSNMAAGVGSQLFCPFRALGFVANHVPLTVQAQGTENLVTTAVGSAFHVYNVGIIFSRFSDFM